MKKFCQDCDNWYDGTGSIICKECINKQYFQPIKSPQAGSEAVSAEFALLCCPCCASKRVQVIKGNIGNRKIWKVFCATCQVRTGPEYSLRKAKEIWNKRAI